MNPLRWILVAASLFGGLEEMTGGPVEIVPPEMRGAIQPQVAVAANGEVYVAFGREGGVFCAASMDGARSFKPPVRVGGLPKLALGKRRGPRIVVTGQGVVVSAISHAEGNLVAWSSLDKGASWSEAVRINSVTNSAREGLHAMVNDRSGNIHAAWLDLRNGRTELWGAVSSNGGRSWGENRLIYKSPEGHICECCHPSLAVDGRGNVHAMWRNWLAGARDMYFSTSVDGGKTYSTASKLGTGTWPLKACPMDGGQLVFGANDELLTVWRRDGTIIASGGAAETVLSGAGLNPVVGAGNGTTLYLWQQGSKLMLKRGTSSPVVFADNGAFAAIASASPASVPVVVWELATNGVKTIMAQRIE
jgi:hypothetical protein